MLLVDDDALIRQHAAEILKNAGCLVIEAGSTEDAMMALQTAPVDVLVTDLHLPGASGVALAEAARAQRGTIAILFATGDGQLAARDALPGDMVLNKPYDAVQLIEAVQAAMRAHDLRPDPEALIPPAPQLTREVEKD